MPPGSDLDHGGSKDALERDDPGVEHHRASKLGRELDRVELLGGVNDPRGREGERIDGRIERGDGDLALSGEHLLGGLVGRDARRHELLHTLDKLDVALRVEPVRRRASAGRRETVPPLPCAERGRRYAGELTHGLDPKTGRLRIRLNVH
ncbi:MAG: hypothetical protein U0414_03840 [Polyangiaceae bacterium]